MCVCIYVSNARLLCIQTKQNREEEKKTKFQVKCNFFVLAYYAANNNKKNNTFFVVRTMQSLGNILYYLVELRAREIAREIFNFIIAILKKYKKQKNVTM